MKIIRNLYFFIVITIHICLAMYALKESNYWLGFSSIIGILTMSFLFGYED